MNDGNTHRVVRARDARRRLAGRPVRVALHDVEPATFDRCARIRDWLDDLGVERITLVVAGDPAGELAHWLADRRRRGDAVISDAPPRAGAALQLDVRPADLDHPRHVLALERILRRARRPLNDA